MEGRGPPSYLWRRHPARSSRRSRIAEETPATGGAVDAIIERHLTELFGRLDAETGDIDLRKRLHAIAVGQAIDLAANRFADNPHLRDTLGRSAATHAPGHAPASEDPD
jgi:hypothetical protein